MVAEQQLANAVESNQFLRNVSSSTKSAAWLSTQLRKRNAWAKHLCECAQKADGSTHGSIRGDLNELWGWKEALNARAAYHARLRSGGRARAPLSGDAALKVPQLRAKLRELGVRLGSGYVKKEELVTRLKAAQTRSGSLLVPRVRRQTTPGAAAAKAVAAAAAAAKKKNKAQQAVDGQKGAKKKKS